jgi:hypothetical protein
MGSSIGQNGLVDLGNAFIGAGEAIGSGAKGVANTVTNLATDPVGTVANGINNVYNATSAAGDYIGARSVDGDFSQVTNAVSNFANNPDQAAQTIGQIAGGVEVGLATTAAAAVAAEAAVTAISEVATAAEAGTAATEAAEGATAAARATSAVAEETAASSGAGSVEAANVAEGAGNGEAALVKAEPEATPPAASEAAVATATEAPGAASAANTGGGNLGSIVTAGNVDSVVARSADALAKARGDILGNIGDLPAILSPNDTLTIVAHGNVGTIAGMTGEEFGQFLLSTGVKPARIELLSCYSSTVCQDVANIMQVPVRGGAGPVNILSGFNGVPQISTGTGLLPPGEGFMWVAPH